MLKQMNEGFDMIHDIFRLKWIPEIIISIANGSHRYTEILSDIEYISHTELNRKLDVLIERRVVEKRGEDSQGGYYLSSFGEDLEHIFRHFHDMSSKYLDI